MGKVKSKKGRPRKTKNDKVDKKIIRDLKNKKDKEQIAEELGMTKGAVSFRIRRMRARGVEVFEEKKPRARTQNDELDNDIFSLLKDGKFQYEIAEELGLSKQAVSMRIRKMRERGEDVPERYDRNNNNRYDELYLLIYGKLKEKKSQQEPADELGYNIDFIKNRIKEMKQLGIKIPKGATGKPRNPKNQDIEEKILGYLAEKKTQMEMADELGVSQCYVSKMIKSMKERGIDIPEQKAGRRRAQVSAQDMDKKVLAGMIVNLMNVKGATEEQVRTMGEYYGVDVEEALNALKGREEER